MLIRIEHHPSPRQLAVFGLMWGAFFGLFAALAAHRGSPQQAWALGAAAIIVPVVGRLWPPLLRIVYIGMTYLTLPVGLVVSCLVLTLLYYLVVTPTGVLMRCLGHDPMHRRIDREAKSYWIPRPPDDDMGRYFRQF